HQNARLTDLSGRFITTLDIREGQGRIPSEMKKGMYLLQVWDDAGKARTLKFLIH
ncbi:MAG: T9SS type A sorting domain-containing protein, partial [Bacteroidales bacterium]